MIVHWKRRDVEPGEIFTQRELAWPDAKEVFEIVRAALDKSLPARVWMVSIELHILVEELLPYSLAEYRSPLDHKRAAGSMGELKAGETGSTEKVDDSGND